MSDSDIINFVREHKEPCVTAGEIAEDLGVTNKAVNYRLNNLAEEGELVGKEVGASAKVWYLRG